MINLPAATIAVARDPLVISAVLLSLAGLLMHLLFRAHPRGRAAVRVILLVALTIILLKASVVPYRPLKPTGILVEDAARRALAIAWWLWAAWFLVGVVRAFVVAEHRPREGKLLQDLLAGLIYIAAILAVIAYVFNLPIQGLLATSGVIAIILGLALQSTLNDVFSGLVLNFSRPYRPGDWISIEGGTDGRVIEMNWRATHLMTARQDLAIVPNSSIAKAKIVNASSPSRIHGMSVTIRLDSGTAPETGVKILQRAILNCRLILTMPAPSITVKSISGSSTEFEITFFVEDIGDAIRSQNELLDLVYRHVAAAGINLAPSGASASPNSEMVSPTKGASQAERALNLVAIFAALTPDERRLLAGKVKERSFDQGETLFEPGVVLDRLSVIGTGVLSLTYAASGKEVELMRLGPGDHFGEMGLLNGTPAWGKLSALVPATVYDLTKEDLAPILKARSTVTLELGCELARRRASGQMIALPEMDEAIPVNRVAGWFSDRLRKLFNLASVI